MKSRNGSFGAQSEEYVPPSTEDIADWSKSCIGILELTETMGKTIDDTLMAMKSDREKIRRRRDFILSKYSDTEVVLDKQLAALPTDLNEYNKLLAKKTSMKAAEERQRELLGLTQDADDDTLVEESTRKLRAYLSGETDEAPTSQLLELNMQENSVLGNSSQISDSSSLSQVPADTSPEQKSIEINGNKEIDTNALKPTKSAKEKKRRKGRKSKGVKAGNSNRKNRGTSRKVGPLSPIRENQAKRPPAAHDRLLKVLEQEEERDIFRAQTLKALEADDPERLEEMKRIFAKERREANKVMEQILSDFKPSKRKSEPVTPLSSKERREKYKKTPKNSRTSGSRSFFPSPKSSTSVRGSTGFSMSDGLNRNNRSATMSAPISIRNAAMSRQSHKQFKAKNMMPGSFAPPNPPDIPENVDKKLIDLNGEMPRKDPVDGAAIDRGVKDLVNDHSTPVDLNFPDLEMYKRSYHDREKWNEPKY